ncbi:MAG: Ig-like domain-containing protein [Puniceicoccaceae bacterium]
MKPNRNIRTALAALATVALAAFPASGATTLHLGPSSGLANETLSVPMEVRSGDGITALQFDMFYDPAVVELSDVRQGIAAAGHILDFETVASGQTRVVVISNTNAVLGDGMVADMEINLLSEVPEGSRALSFSNVIISDLTGTEVAIAWAPYIAITSPAEGKRYSASSNVGLSAVAIDYDGSITSVEFQIDGESLSIDTAAPYTATWTAAGSGAVALTAIAVSSGGTQTASLPVTIQIGPPPFVGWRDANFTPAEQADNRIGGLASDPDGDTIPNLLEYALGLNPREFDFEDLPEVGLIGLNQESYATLTYRANPGADDIIFMVEVSGDGGATWSSGEGNTEEMSSEMVDSKREVKTRDLHPVTTGSEPNRLIRLTVKMTGI